MTKPKPKPKLKPKPKDGIAIAERSPTKTFVASKKVAKKCTDAYVELSKTNPIVITNVNGEDLRVNTPEDLVALVLNLRDRLNDAYKELDVYEDNEDRRSLNIPTEGKTIKASITFERVHECGIAAMNRKRAERNGGPIEYER